MFAISALHLSSVLQPGVVASQSVETVRGGIGLLLDGSALRWGLGSVTGVAGGLARAASGTNSPVGPHTSASLPSTGALSGQEAPDPGTTAHFVEASDAARPEARQTAQSNTAGSMAALSCAAQSGAAPSSTVLSKASHTAAAGSDAACLGAHPPDATGPGAEHVHVQISVQKVSGGAERAQVLLQVGATPTSEAAAAAEGTSSRLPLSTVLGGLFTRRPAAEPASKPAEAHPAAGTAEQHRMESIQVQARRAVAAAQSAQHGTPAGEMQVSGAAEPRAPIQPPHQATSGSANCTGNYTTKNKAAAPAAPSGGVDPPAVQDPLPARQEEFAGSGSSWFGMFGRGVPYAEVSPSSQHQQQQQPLASTAVASDTVPINGGSAAAAVCRTVPIQPHHHVGNASDPRQTTEERRALLVGLELAERLRDIITNVLQAHTPSSHLLSPTLHAATRVHT